MNASAFRLITASCVLVLQVVAQDEGSDWRVRAREMLGEDGVRQLERDRFLITSGEFVPASSVGLRPQRLRQCSDAYVRTDGFPVFVTTDALLNAFHVLLEDSVLELERRSAVAMRERLERSWERLSDVVAQRVKLTDRALVAAAEHRIRMVLAVALRLLDVPVFEEGDERRALVEEEVRRIEAASGQYKPAWLGPGDPEFLVIDYARFRPLGSFDRTEARRKHYRVRKWLQSIPFRVSRPEELLAYWLVKYRWGWNEDVLGAYDLLLGERVSSPERRRFLQLRLLDDEVFRTCRAELLAHLAPPRISDLVAVQPLGPSFRLIPPSALHEEVLFETMGRVLEMGPPRSSGVLLAAALGSPVARGELTDPVRRALEAVLPDSLQLDRPRSVHELYLACLSRLLLPPEPDAPAFMRGTPWQRKATQTIAASWAQARHTWVLKVGWRKKALGASRSDEFLGFVEPVPRFYEEFGTLVGEYQRVFEWASLFQDEDPTIDEVVEEQEGELEVPRMGEAPLDEKAPAFDEGGIGIRGQSLQRRWELLDALSERLEYMTYKQLRGVPWSAREVSFFTGLSETLAILMDMEGQRLYPPDDAPRAVPVWEDPFEGPEILHAAIGRPQWIYVLYPWKGDDVLCRGAVMPYHEFVSSEPWTDVRWKEELDRPDGLARTPTWLAPISLK
ncbi:MAG: DUF3160 domain-containing protein [Planctomycetes bacterium]|nr:DUF3160 domain-containing protein [Planctomycetota bacterium]